VEILFVRGEKHVLFVRQIVVILLLVVTALVMAVKPATHVLRIVAHRQVVIISVALIHPMTNVAFVVGMIVLVQIALVCQMVIAEQIIVVLVIMIVPMTVYKIVRAHGEEA
jgi:hypothetical protein